MQADNQFTNQQLLSKSGPNKVPYHTRTGSHHHRHYQ